MTTLTILRHMAPIRKRVVVPWFDRAEWEMVHKELYSSNAALQKHAMERIAVWKCRQNNRLPIAAECTCQLVSAQVTDFEAEQLRIPDEEVQLGYAMAVVRFVNLITETAQTRMYARPIHLIAQEVGLPEWLVELRHEATHGPLPSIHLLRSAASIALNWLKGEYWDIPWSNLQIKDFTATGYENREARRRRAMDVLVDYMQHRFEVLESKKEDKTEFNRIIGELSRAMSGNREEFVKVLCMEGYLIPTAEQLLSLNCEVPNIDGSPPFAIPDSFRLFWLPALKVLHDTSSLGLLVKQLIRSMDDSGSVSDFFRCAWTLHYINRMKKASYRTKKTSVNHWIFETLLRACVQIPNKYTKHIALSLLPMQQPPLNDVQTEKLVRLLDIYQRCYDSNNIQEHVNEKEPQKLDTLLNLYVSASQKMPCQEFSNEVWHNVPLGVCPDLKVTTTNLELPEYLNRLQEDSAMGPDGPVHAQESTSENEGFNNEDDNMDISMLEECTSQPGGPGTSWNVLEKQKLSAAVTIF